MAVLVEGISVIVRMTSIHERFPGGWEAFRARSPNQTLCGDGEIARLGFMSPADAEAFVRSLEQYGIVYRVQGKARDVVVVDQVAGPMVACDWIEFGNVNLGPDGTQRVAACRQSQSTITTLATPESWAFENSLSASFGFVPDGQLSKSLRFLRHEDGLDVYLNELTGAEVYIGRVLEPPR